MNWVDWRDGKDPDAAITTGYGVVHVGGLGERGSGATLQQLEGPER